LVSATTSSSSERDGADTAPDGRVAAASALAAKNDKPNSAKMAKLVRRLQYI
jgi:hypothetical protein